MLSSSTIEKDFIKSKNSGLVIEVFNIYWYWLFILSLNTDF